VHLEPNDSGRRGLHFWEDVKLTPPDINNHLASFTLGPGSLAHVALYHPDAAAAAALRTRLKAGNISVIDFAELGTYAFSDPNGVMVEIATADPDEP
jgi:catechol 2,3-dioxygenase-like lactoylglutathione lyase family enzyme